MKRLAIALAVSVVGLVVGCEVTEVPEAEYTPAPYPTQTGSITILPSANLFASADRAVVTVDGVVVGSLDDSMDSVYVTLSEGEHTFSSCFFYDDSRRDEGKMDGPYTITVGGWFWDHTSYVTFSGVVPSLIADNGRALPLPAPNPIIQPETDDTSLLSVTIGITPTTDDMIEIYVDGQFVSRVTDFSTYTVEVDRMNHVLYAEHWNDTGLVKTYGPVTQFIDSYNWTVD